MHAAWLRLLTPTSHSPDILSLCHTVGFEDAVVRAGKQFAYQGNMDSGVLFAGEPAEGCGVQKG